MYITSKPDVNFKNKFKHTLLTFFMLRALRRNNHEYCEEPQQWVTTPTRLLAFQEVCITVT